MWGFFDLQWPICNGKFAMKKILVCLDPDPQPSVFDSIVALDSGVDHLLRHSGVKPEDVQSLVHGAIFNRIVRRLVRPRQHFVDRAHLVANVAVTQMTAQASAP